MSRSFCFKNELRGNELARDDAVSKLRAIGGTRAMTPLSAAVRDYVRNYLVPDKKLGE